MRTHKGKKAVFVIPETNFHDQEYLVTKNILEKAGVKVFVSAESNIFARGQYGLRVKPEMILMNLHPENFDAIVLIGGSGSKNLWNNQYLHRILKEFYTQNKLICAICSAVGILASADLLKGKRVTCFAGDIEQIQIRGAIVTSSKTECDINIITANGPDSAGEFANLIIDKLSKK
ncbi:MAG: DJ-1/PfpI family protein [Ignavibacteria bacterium]|nr:DJ-1/PfpI family protein [Ignavibacteria bacterium]